MATDEVVNGGPGARSERPHESTHAQLWLRTTIAGILRAVVDGAAHPVRTRGRNYYRGVADGPRHEPAVLQTARELAANTDAASAAARVAAEGAGGGVGRGPRW